MKAARLALLLVLTVFAAVGAFAQKGRPDQSSERTTFYADDQSFGSLVPIPPKVLAELVKTEAGREGLEFASVGQKPNLANLFRAVKVHLSGSYDPALLVGGVGLMSGADNDWFWIVSAPYKEPKVILFCGANSVELLDSESGGYRDIRCTWSSASETVRRLYCFTEGRYKLLQEQWSENSPTK